MVVGGSIRELQWLMRVITLDISLLTPAACKDRNGLPLIYYVVCCKKLLAFSDSNQQFGSNQDNGAVAFIKVNSKFLPSSASVRGKEIFLNWSSLTQSQFNTSHLQSDKGMKLNKSANNLSLEVKLPLLFFLLDSFIQSCGLSFSCEILKITLLQYHWKDADTSKKTLNIIFRVNRPLSLYIKQFIYFLSFCLRNRQ